MAGQVSGTRRPSAGSSTSCRSSEPASCRTRREKAQADFDHRCAVLRERLAQPDFLGNRGLGNEVGIFTFCYDPALELQMRAFVVRLKHEADAGILPCRIVERNLYDALLEICRRKRILDAIPKQEQKRGQEGLLKQLQKTATPEAFVSEVNYPDHQPGDVLLITGVGEVYPFLRAHVLLDNIQHLFEDMPVVLMYPGSFDGQSLVLFNKLTDGNYYRAFDLV
ncbi:MULTISPECIES: DUF1788 domain-containing protein [unclassified Adlercreutzia]|uniref:DUF1788 domain-containing protein n=1 Tax=unclassified Adlercreutzia TaxID=2636013 RepID=UPI0013EDC626|nr:MULTISPECIES: DUF1788 domain-containing protein [unclassified Adlercreutzia]